MSPGPLARSLLTAFALSACAKPDPDALLRAARVDDAVAAYKAQTGRTLDLNHHGADGLARRAPRDPSMTCAELERRILPAELLDQTPLVGRRTLEMSFPKLGPVLAAAFDAGGTLVAVGRSQNPSEREVEDGGDLRWVDGRVVGGAQSRDEALTLGDRLDASPPPRLVTVGMTDGRGTVFFTMKRDGDVWLTINSLSPDAAAAWITSAVASPLTPRAPAPAADDVPTIPTPPPRATPTHE